ncbi:hypothetical protein Q5O_10645 [Pseudomonas putida JB]|nr:hypothetical protein Q5O_10645 [Pseudomonas putida JB]
MQLVFVIQGFGFLHCSPCFHQVVQKVLTLLIRKRGIAAAPELTFDYEVATIGCCRMHSANLVS